jgi:hypothetical protein
VKTERESRAIFKCEIAFNTELAHYNDLALEKRRTEYVTTYHFLRRDKLCEALSMYKGRVKTHLEGAFQRIK